MGEEVGGAPIPSPSSGCLLCNRCLRVLGKGLQQRKVLQGCLDCSSACCIAIIGDGLLLSSPKFNPAPEQLLAGQMATANEGSKSKVSGVRFAPTQTVEGPSSHVHFDEKLHDSVVMVTQEKDGTFLVKVGFLKIMHKYEIHFVLPFLPQLGKVVYAAPLTNLNLRVISIASVSEGYSITCEYVAHKEGVLREEMVLCSEAHDPACVKVIVQARVMDRHHGTPMLLEGVKCIGMEFEYDSEQSDGFD